MDDAEAVARLREAHDRAKARWAERQRQVAEQEQREREKAQAKFQQLLATLQVVDDIPSQAEAERMQRERRDKERQDAHRARFFRTVNLRKGAHRAWNNELEPGVSAMAARHWLSGDRSQHFMLRGGVGCGKSTAAALIVRFLTEYPQRYGGVCWLKPDDFTSAVLHAYDEKAPRLERNIVLDDIGRETKAGFVEAWCQLIEHPRHTLIMTTNLTREQLEARYDERIITRLGDTTIVVDDPGPNRRLTEDD